MKELTNYQRVSNHPNLPDIQQFVGLEGEAPEGMALDKGDGLLQELLPAGRVRNVAGLEEEVAGREAFPGQNLLLGEQR